ncbi:MAG: hypothetical protein ACR2F8_04210 [Caulobacteraceae bacterium]
MRFKNLLLGSCAFSAVACAGVGLHAQPAGPAGGSPSGSGPTSDVGQSRSRGQQDVGANSATAVGEVIVTAKSNRGTALQHVAAAVTAFTDERRNLLGILTPLDIAKFTPSASLQGEFLSIRGVGREESAQPGLGVDPGIVSSIDGLYASSPATLDRPDFLTDRIEVLPGPQIVFGHSSLGGTVDVISKRPTESLHADVRAGVTTLDDAYFQGAVSGPITDQLRYRLAYEYSDQWSAVQNNVAPYPDTNQRRDQTSKRNWIGRPLATSTSGFDIRTITTVRPPHTAFRTATTPAPDWLVPTPPRRPASMAGWCETRSSASPRPAIPRPQTRATSTSPSPATYGSTTLIRS